MKRPTATHAAGRRPPPATHRTPRTPSIGVLLVCPHALDRVPLARLLAATPGVRVAGEVWDAASLATATATQPAVLLVALTLVGLRDGLDLPAVRTRFPGVPVVALAPHEEDECLALPHPRSRAATTEGVGTEPLPALDCLTLAVLQGARGALRRDADPGTLVRALLEVARGGHWYDESLSRGILAWARFSARGDPAAFLSGRESEVAERIAAGASNKEIATALGVSEPTVKRHVGGLLRRFRLEDRLQLGLFLTRHAYLFARRNRG